MQSFYSASSSCCSYIFAAGTEARRKRKKDKKTKKSLSLCSLYICQVISSRCKREHKKTEEHMKKKKCEQRWSNSLLSLSLSLSPAYVCSFYLFSILCFVFLFLSWTVSLVVSLCEYLKTNRANPSNNTIHFTLGTKKKKKKKKTNSLSSVSLSVRLISSLQVFIMSPSSECHPFTVSFIAAKYIGFFLFFSRVPSIKYIL